MNPKIYFVVLNWNGKEFSIECLNSIFRQSYKNFKVVFVDNASTDGSVEAVQKKFRDKRLEIVCNKSDCGVTGGYNTGIRFALANGAEWVFVLNNDTIVEENCLSNAVKAINAHPEVSAIAPKVYSMDGKRIDSAGLLFYNYHMLISRGTSEPGDRYNEPEFVVGPHGAVALYKAELIKDLIADNKEGYFLDEDLFMWHEEADVAWRAFLRGWKCLYVPNAVAYHVGSGTVRRAIPETEYYKIRNRIFVFVKNVPQKFLLKGLMYSLSFDMFSLAYYLSKGSLLTWLRARFDSILYIKRYLRKRAIIQKRSKNTDIDRLMVLAGGLGEVRHWKPKLYRGSQSREATSKHLE